MSNRYFVALATTYLGITLSYGLFFLHDFSASSRAIIIFFFTVPVVVTHISVFFSRAFLWSRRYFFIATLLWIIKLVVFTLNEGLHYFKSGLPLLDWLDLLLLLSICLFVSISFLLGRPFFYQPIRSKAIVLLGIGGLFITAGIAGVIGVSLYNFF